MSTWTVSIWLRAFLLALAVESPIAVPLLRPFEPNLGRRLAAVCFANLASHPLVWFAFPQLELPYGWMAVLAETWAVLGETAFYRLVFPPIPLVRALGIALLANGASFALGLLLSNLLFR